MVAAQLLLFVAQGSAAADELLVVVQGFAAVEGGEATDEQAVASGAAVLARRWAARRCDLVVLCRGEVWPSLSAIGGKSLISEGGRPA